MNIILCWIAHHLKALGLNINALGDRGMLGKVCYQPSRMAAPENSSPSGTQYTLMDEEDSVSSREISRRQEKKTGRNEVSQIKEDSKLTLLKKEKFVVLGSANIYEATTGTTQTTCQALAGQLRTSMCVRLHQVT